MTAQRRQEYITVDEWRKLEQANEEKKYEYIDGQVYLIAQKNLAHARIGSNFVQRIMILEELLSDGTCYVYGSNVIVRLSETRYIYPDASISCDPRDKPAIDKMEVQTPRVIVEVLSDSTEGIDRLKKAHLYHACPSIQEYMLVATRYQAVEVQRRTGDEWTVHVFGPGDEVGLTSIGVHFPLSALYRGTTVPEVMNE